MPRRKRRDKGSGSVHQIKGRGWVAQRERPRQNGKRRYERRFFGPGRAGRLAATDQVSAWQQEQQALARHVRSADSTGQWLQHWLANKKPNVESTTYQFYARHIGYALPHIGEIRLIDLAVAPQRIRDMLAALTDLSPQSRKHVRTVLSMALDAAVADGIIPRNPCKTVEVPKVEKYEAYALNDAELSALLAAFAGHRLEAMWRIMADFGTRLDEILSARWADYDSTRRRLRIKATKTGRERYLNLGEQHTALLAAHWAALQIEREATEGWTERGYLFPSEVGTKLLQSNVRRLFKEKLEAAGLPHHIRIHDLRHTAATNLIAAGVDIPTTQYITGHKDSKVLLEIYAHSQDDRNQEALAKVEARRKRDKG